MNNLKNKLLACTISTLVLGVLFPFGVFAQAQDDVNPDFNLSSEEQKYIELNYDCSGVPWPEGAVSVYRRIGSDGQVSNYWINKDESIVELESKNGFKSSDLLPKPKLMKYPSGEKQIVCYYKGKYYAAVSIPPTLQQIENYFLDGVYIFWSLIGIYSVFRIISLGFEYMTSATSPERLGAVTAKIRTWFVAVLLAGLAVPFLHFLYKTIGIQSTKCYYMEEKNEVVYDLTVPGFTFFFKDVCTDGDLVGVNNNELKDPCAGIKNPDTYEQCVENNQNR